MKKLKSPPTVSDLIRKRFQGLRDAPEDESIQQVVLKRWGRCAGNAAIHSSPLLFRSGRLVVYTHSAIWRTELHHQKRKIISTLKDMGVNRVDVRIAPANHPPPPEKKSPIPVSRESRTGIIRTAERLQHSGLRAAVDRLGRRAETDGSE